MPFRLEKIYYSQKKCTNLTGIEMEKMIKVDCDENRAMKPESLHSTIREKKAKGRKPFYVGATAGSTVLGAYNPFNALENVFQEGNFWIHIDGACRGTTLLSNK